MGAETVKPLADVSVVRVDQFLDNLNHPKIRGVWPVARIAKQAGLPRSVVYRAISAPGKNMSMKTLASIVAVFGGEVVIMVNRKKL